MAQAARADLESLLQRHRLDHTLTSVKPPEAGHDPLPTAVPALDHVLQGGLPRGQMSELIGPASSGRTTVLLQLMAATTREGELVGLVDGLDRFDPASAAAAGIVLDQVLWLRGHLVSHVGVGRELNQRELTRAIEACALMIQSGGFGLVALDLGGLPAAGLRRVPFTTWLRLQRMLEESQTACVLLGDVPMARSTAGLTLALTADHAGPAPASISVGAGFCAGPLRRVRLLEGPRINVQAIHARARWAEDGRCAVATALIGDELRMTN
ncbi:MAG TPA: hypothetical protein VIC33_13505 [Vicinamibacterales bacterium]|jgi:hypothetical protein